MSSARARIATRVSALVTMVAISACGHVVSGGDADATVADADAGEGIGDVLPADAAAPVADGSDAVAPPDTTPDVIMLPPTCGAGLIDLTAYGHVSGNTTTYVGSNVGAAPVPEVPGDARCTALVGYEVALLYIMNNPRHLRVSTDNAGTTPTFETVVWAIDHCRPINTMSFGCDGELSATDLHSTFTTASTLGTGMSVYIVVAGLVPSRVGTPTGTFELTIAEIPEVAPGGACDPSGVTNVCATGSFCLADATGMATCAPDGQAGAPCRVTDPACDSGLACSGNAYDPASRCLPAVPVGATCDATLAANACVAGSHCLPSAGVGSGSTCVADGTLGGECSATPPPCQCGLACNDDTYVTFARCVPIVAEGGACDTSGAGAANVCVEGTTCVGDDLTGTCLADGAMGAQCRDTATPCDPGLACNGDPGLTGTRCLTADAVGAACDPSGFTNACVPGSHCVTSSSGSVCVLDGSAGGYCRATTTPTCDAMLTCNGVTSAVTSRCVPLVAPGSACDTANIANVCASGAHCVSGVCATDGSAGALCRIATPVCDAGLGCLLSASSGVATCVTGSPAGAACDPASMANACVAGTHCLTNGPTATCVSDGSLGGVCLPTGANCDAGLGCGVDPLTGQARCEPAVALGGSCDPNGLTNICVSGSHCIGPAGVAVCVQDGTTGGYCLATPPVCGTGLACGVDSITELPSCVTAVADGGACDPNGQANACVSGDHCIGSGNAAVCIADGSAGGFCDPTAPMCAAGLGCLASDSGTGSCVSGVAVGAACDPAGFTNACVTGSHCVTAGGSATCVSDGTLGGRCIASGPPCDSGLACNGDPTIEQSVCIPLVAIGGVCDAAGIANECISGAHCIGTATSNECIADGTAAGECRIMGMPCDPGLACNGAVEAASSRCQ